MLGKNVVQHKPAQVVPYRGPVRSRQFDEAKYRCPAMLLDRPNNLFGELGHRCHQALSFQFPLQRAFLRRQGRNVSTWMRHFWGKNSELFEVRVDPRERSVFPCRSLGLCSEIARKHAEGTG